MTHGDLTFLLYVAWAALALWCIPWATILHATDRASQRRVDRMVADGLAAIRWAPGPDPFLEGPAVQPGDPDHVVVWVTGHRSEGGRS